MKLAINYIVKGTSYRLVINAEKLKVYEELDNVLKEICEKFNGEVEEYSVSRAIQGSIAISICFYRMKVT